METRARSTSSVLYRLPSLALTDRYILSTPETRSICNDPLVFGVEYTSKLKNGILEALRLFKTDGEKIGDETHALVLHILRGGLNFGIRDALFESYRWSATTSAFISSQRVFTNETGWKISEDSYRKMPRVIDADLIFGDIVATGVSLRHSLDRLIDEAEADGTTYRSITFFTIGGNEAEKLVEAAAQKCAALFPNFTRARVIYLEGIFGVPEKNSTLSIALPGTDLLRNPALLAPEFAKSQEDSLSYALERCTIYDAGSRAFDPQEYLRDVIDYWEKVRALSEKGTSLISYLAERLPSDPRLLDPSFVKQFDSSTALTKVCDVQISKLRAKL